MNGYGKKSGGCFMSQFPPIADPEFSSNKKGQDHSIPAAQKLEQPLANLARISGASARNSQTSVPLMVVNDVFAEAKWARGMSKKYVRVYVGEGENTRNLYLDESGHFFQISGNDSVQQLEPASIQSDSRPYIKKKNIKYYYHVTTDKKNYEFVSDSENSNIGNNVGLNINWAGDSATYHHTIRLDNKMYMVLDRLAEGANGLIYLVKDSVGQERVLKESHSDEFGDQHRQLIHTQTGLETESRIMRLYKIGLKSTSLEDIFTNSSEPSESFYSILEKVDGVNLKSVELLLDEMRPFIQESLRSLMELHSYLNFVHRDIKPSNMIIRFDGRIKLVDLDSSQDISRGSKWNGDYVGTPGFIFNSTDLVYNDRYSMAATIFNAITKKGLKGKGNEEIKFSNPVQILFNESINPTLSQKNLDYIMNSLHECLSEDPDLFKFAAITILDLLNPWPYYRSSSPNSVTDNVSEEKQDDLLPKKSIYTYKYPNNKGGTVEINYPFIFSKQNYDDLFAYYELNNDFFSQTIFGSNQSSDL